MADDLDEFLKQAAKRRQQRQQNKAERPPIAKPPTLSPEQPRAPNIPLAEVVQESNRSIGNLTPSLSSAPPLSPGVDRADERMSAHVTHVFQHELGKLRETNRSDAKKSLTPTTSSEVPNAASITPSNRASDALLRQLRDPQNIRLAIIAHEILKRPWQ